MDEKQEGLTALVGPDGFVKQITHRRRHWRSGDNDDVREFHEKFDVPMNQKPGPMEASTQEFRLNFMKEELREYEEAIAAGDMEKAFDSLIDLAYVVHGAALIHGFPWAEGWHRVQAANMAKVAVRNTTGTGRHVTDVVKPEGWTPPDLSDLVDPDRAPPIGNGALS